jgi:hypothetical protein
VSSKIIGINAHFVGPILETIHGATIRYTKYLFVGTKLINLKSIDITISGRHD